MPLSIKPTTRAYLSSGLERLSTSKSSIRASKTSAFYTVSTLAFININTGLLSVYCKGHGQNLVLQALQTTPPIFSINSAPFITIEFSLVVEMIPHSFAMARAVIKLSPVTILTRTPASMQVFIAPGTSSRKISFIPKRHKNVNSVVSILKTPFSSLVSKSSKYYCRKIGIPSRLIIFFAMIMVLKASFAMLSIAFSIFFIFEGIKS